MAEERLQAGVIPVQVCYVPPGPGEAVMMDLDVAPGTTLAQAIALPAVTQRLPVQGLRIGIWGKLVAPETVLRAQDRIELYRPLIADPMEARRRRARRKTAAAR